MRTLIFALIGLCLAFAMPGCDSGNTDISNTDSGGGDKDSGGLEDTGMHDGDDAAPEADAPNDEEPDCVFGPRDCIDVNTEYRIGCPGEYNCGLKRCVPGHGCPAKCETDDDCVNPEDIGWDPATWEFYCDGIHTCTSRHVSGS